jgi:hypothetical protein
MASNKPTTIKIKNAIVGQAWITYILIFNTKPPMNKIILRIVKGDL